MPISASAPGTAPLDQPEEEIARREVITESQFTGMVLRSHSRESRSKVRADVHSERSGFATRPEPEVARPETEIAPVAGPSYGEISVVDSRSPSVEVIAKQVWKLSRNILFRSHRNRK